MMEEKVFRVGINISAIAASVSLIAVAVTWLIASREEFQIAAESWNCQVVQGAIWPPYCVPGPLRLSIFALIFSALGFGGLVLNRALASENGSYLKEGEVSPLNHFWRFLIGAGIVGTFDWMAMYIHTYVIDYQQQYRGIWNLAWVILPAVGVSKLIYPRLNLFILTLPLAVSGFVSFLFIAVFMGMVFD